MLMNEKPERIIFLSNMIRLTAASIIINADPSILANGMFFIIISNGSMVRLLSRNMISPLA